MPLLEVSGLSIAFRSPQGGMTQAVEDLSLSLERGEGLAVVGESGSGKSVSALALARLLPEPPAVIHGSIRFDGTEIMELRGEALRAVRGRRIAYIFQEPSSALNPVFSVRSQLGEVILTRGNPGRSALEQECVHWLTEVGITDPARRLDDYPHQLSGGMQQRVMIAMALAGKPDLLVADEPTTALDVTIQKQIIELLASLKQKHGMSVLIITHNFGIIRGIADRVAVMYRGRLVETGRTEQVLSAPQHPYTRALIDCIPRLGRKRRRLATISLP